MDTRRRRESEIAKEREDSDDEEETVKPEKVAVDLVDVQVMSTSEEDDEEQVVEMPETISEPMYLPDLTYVESDSEQEELVDNLAMKSQTEESEICEESEDDDGTEPYDETGEEATSTPGAVPWLVNPADTGCLEGTSFQTRKT